MGELEGRSSELGTRGLEAPTASAPGPVGLGEGVGGGGELTHFCAFAPIVDTGGACLGHLVFLLGFCAPMFLCVCASLLTACTGSLRRTTLGPLDPPHKDVPGSGRPPHPHPHPPLLVAFASKWENSAMSCTLQSCPRGWAEAGTSLEVTPFPASLLC